MKRKVDSADQIEEQRSQKIRLTVNNEVNLLDLLPRELIHGILQYLNNHERRHARLISQHIFSIIYITHFNIGMILESEIEQLVSVFGRYPNLIGLSFKKLGCVHRSISEISRLTNLSALHVGRSRLVEPRFAAEVPKLTNLQSLRLDEQTESSWTHLTKLTSLFINTIRDTSDLPTSLQDLQFVKSTNGFNDPKLTFPNMTQLDAPLRIMKDVERIAPNLKRCICVSTKLDQQFSCNLPNLEQLQTSVKAENLNAEKLTHLDLFYYAENENFGWCTHLTNLKCLECPIELLNLHYLRFTKLEKLIPTTFLADSENTVRQLTLSYLTELSINNITSHEAFERIMGLTNLRGLKLSIAPSPSPNGPIYFTVDLKNLSKLTRLTKLECSLYGGLGTVVNSSAINSLTRLEELDLTCIKDSVKVPFMNLNRLTSLSLSVTTYALNSEEFAPRDLVELFLFQPLDAPLTKFMNLTSLCTEEPSIGWEQVSALTRLLDLSFKPEDHVGQVSLTNLTSLQCELVCGGCGEFTKLTRLQSLRISADDLPRDFNAKMYAACKFLVTLEEEIL